ncbi:MULTISPECIES: universal stress protein [unclassified Photobacterium]|uniref:universal stress protein n=1 Tax=unclassified Photobacterium TaxID=2628852 RepID=UPI000D16F961|nr:MULTISPECIES: universal stress protein [unclassified Photobacterium]PSV24846.1 universal stress protein [Photobacterium sp. GB-56]PSV29408.1 universal stress protein [Photobacterium sp. GB-72]PSV35278.1 universal stress protein [Photobacterium sp. GB-27]PSV35705.1 universal stress protein [Photobacterium sp. GB-210]PSV42365.1 universal stress protein [Photobacterium sp. GB-36]
MSLYQTVLLAVNPEDKNAHKLMVKAGVIAEQNHADLHVAYVEPGIGNVSFIDVEVELQEEHDAIAKKRMKELSDLITASSHKVKAIHTADGDVSKHIEALAKELNASLVITGYHKSTFHLFGDLSDSLANHLGCDVLISQ